MFLYALRHNAVKVKGKSIKTMRLKHISGFLSIIAILLILCVGKCRKLYAGFCKSAMFSQKHGELPFFTDKRAIFADGFLRNNFNVFGNYRKYYSGDSRSP